MLSWTNLHMTAVDEWDGQGETHVDSRFVVSCRKFSSSWADMRGCRSVGSGQCSLASPWVHGAETTEARHRGQNAFRHLWMVDACAENDVLMGMLHLNAV